MCFDTTASNISRLSAACDDIKIGLARICCVWHVHNVVVGEVFKHVLWSIIWVHHWLNHFHDYWLENDKSQFHTAYACVEVLTKLVILLQCKFLILVSRLMMITVNF